jgi:hypothetical protein
MGGRGFFELEGLKKLKHKNLTLNSNYVQTLKSLNPKLKSNWVEDQSELITTTSSSTGNYYHSSVDEIQLSYRLISTSIRKLGEIVNR